MSADQEAFQELCFYTLSHVGDEFLHQHAVDAFAVQTATTASKPISLIFGLAGLFLLIEKGMTGWEVQRFHMKMARYKRPWPEIPLPDARGALTVHDVLRVEPGPERDTCIMEWCRSVWMAYADGQDRIRDLVSGMERLP
jgi:Family of unknown function (DUF5946)